MKITIGKVNLVFFFFFLLIFWQVLGPGGANEPVELLSDFLGREPSIQAFVDSKAEYSF
jgi:hypothetical protein